MLLQRAVPRLLPAQPITLPFPQQQPTMSIIRKVGLPVLRGWRLLELSAQTRLFQRRQQAAPIFLTVFPAVQLPMSREAAIRPLHTVRQPIQTTAIVPLQMP